MIDIEKIKSSGLVWTISLIIVIIIIVIIVI